MKNTFIAFLTGVLFTSIFAFTNSNNGNEKDLSLAKVNKMSGKYVFMECEPVNDYEIVYELTGFTLGNWDSPKEIADFVFKLARKEKEKQQKEYDAIIVGSNKTDLAIKFK